MHSIVYCVAHTHKLMFAIPVGLQHFIPKVIKGRRSSEHWAVHISVVLESHYVPIPTHGLILFKDIVFSPIFYFDIQATIVPSLSIILYYFL